MQVPVPDSRKCVEIIENSILSAKAYSIQKCYALYVIYSHDKYAYIHMYMFMQHHNDTINNQTDAQW